ncbi:hypothetical protein PaG_03094 [Moesziomyces aphidis]|uniref:Integral membrane bound transporter domain-containing protein n=1 Tax=Moesziomyces aphidis TaxID=84754 RepID=W3VLD5_MOEAP|nr:hypothetical protein PaG_03094 [Moesziomyces aphidis]
MSDSSATLDNAKARRGSRGITRIRQGVERIWPRIKLLAPPVAGALLISPFVLERRLKTWISADPFFAYIHFFLFFFPSSLATGAFLERSIITLVFVAAGTGIAFGAICGAISIDGAGAAAYSSKQSRAIGVCTLIFLSVVSGVLSSYAPRLRGPCRALLFSTVWELTKQYNVATARIFLDSFYPALVAMVVGIFCNCLIFPRTARRTSIDQLCQLFQGTDQLMAKAIQEFSVNLKPNKTLDDGPQGVTAQGLPSASFKQLKEQLGSLQTRLEANFDAARYEVGFARVGVEQMHVFLPILRDIRAWFSCSLACLGDAKQQAEGVAATEIGSESVEQPMLSTSVDATQAAFDFKQSIHTFSVEVSAALTCLHWTVRKCTGSSALDGVQPSSGSNEKGQHRAAASDDPHLALAQQKQRLRASIRTFKAALNDAVRESRAELNATSASQAHPKAGMPVGSGLGVHLPDSHQAQASVGQPKVLADMFRTEAYQISFLMVSLLEVGLLVDACLTGGLALAAAWKSSPHRRLRMSAAKLQYWLGHSELGVRDDMVFMDERVDALLHEDEPPSPELRAESEQLDYFNDDAETFVLGDAPRLDRTQSRVSNGISTIRSWCSTKLRAMHSVLRTRRATRWRMALSRRIRALRHSRHIKFGIKLAGGFVLLTLPSWLAPGEAKQWWLQQRGQWMAISYLFCLETSTGASIRTSFFRILGTVSGSLLGLVINEVSRGNDYALAFLLTLATLPPSYVMLFTQLQGVGIVMGLTLPIVALLPTEESGESVVHVAWNRGYMIFFGIIAALVVNLFVWPIHARLELVRRVSSITSQLQSLYLSLSRQMLSGGLTSSHKSNAAFERLEVGIERRVGQARGLVDIMKIEVSLQPKRTRVLSELLDHLQMILELLMGLRRCREHGLRSVRQQAVVNVLELRQSLIASVLLVLWTTGQALQTHAPLPQYLPSPRLALEELTEAVAEQLRTMLEEQEPVRPQGVPDAFHALDSLNHEAILASVRRRHRKHGLHSIQSASPALGLKSGTITPKELKRSAVSGNDSPASAGTRKRNVDFAVFFILAEHALLEEIVASLEHLLELCRSMVGEATFLYTQFVPTDRTPGDTTPAQPRGAEPSDTDSATATPVASLGALGTDRTPTLRPSPLAHASLPPTADP